jgi:16S rRNA (uracil1498-N3)-methyltransferase
MNLNRFFWAGPEEGPVTLDSEESHHLLKVLRLKPRTGVELYDGEGWTARGIFAGVKGGKALVEITEATRAERSRPAITIACGLTKPPSMNLIVEKLSEIGIDCFIPLLTEHTSERFYQSHLQRWEKIARQSLKVNGLSFAPRILPPLKLAELVRDRNGYSSRLLFDIQGNALAQTRSPKPLLVVIGPPGDFSAVEKRTLLAEGFTAVRINETILKTDTAAILAAGLLKNA